MKYILTGVYILFTTMGLLCLKLGGNNPISLSLSSGFNLKVGYVSLLGLVLYVCSFLLWQRLLGVYDLSYIVPITTGIVQFIVLLIGVFIFKENINYLNIIGVFLIIIGIILVGIKR